MFSFLSSFPLRSSFLVYNRTAIKGRTWSSPPDRLAFFFFNIYDRIKVDNGVCYSMWSTVTLEGSMVQFGALAIHEKTTKQTNPKLPVGRHQLPHHSPRQWRRACWKMQMSNAMSSPGPGTPHLPACKMEKNRKKCTKYLILLMPHLYRG